MLCMCVCGVTIGPVQGEFEPKVEFDRLSSTNSVFAEKWQKRENLPNSTPTATATAQNHKLTDRTHVGAKPEEIEWKSCIKMNEFCG